MSMRVEIEHVDKKSGARQGVVAIFNERELAVAIFEAMMEIKHPATMTWQEAFGEITERSPEALEICRRCANAAMQYFAKQVGEAGRQPEDRTQ